MASPTSDVTISVDPQCPFAWITYRWLQQVQELGLARVSVQLMSLSCVNEHQDLDPGYRAYNDDAWAAARVASGLLASSEASRWPAFYQSFARRRHVEGMRDNRANIAQTLAELHLPSSLAAVADSSDRDDDLRRRTQEAVQGVDGPGGTPITRLGDRAYFGPVLTSVPDAQQSAQLWEALCALADVSGFASVATRRSETLDTGR